MVESRIQEVAAPKDSSCQVDIQVWFQYFELIYKVPLIEMMAPVNCYPELNSADHFLKY